MIISNKPVAGILKAYGEQNRVNKAANSDKGSVSSKRDEVEISSTAQEFGQMLQSLKKTPEVRETVVKDFSERIESGNYTIDSRAVAEKMLSQLASDRLRS